MIQPSSVRRAPSRTPTAGSALQGSGGLASATCPAPAHSTQAAWLPELTRAGGASSFGQAQRVGACPYLA